VSTSQPDHRHRESRLRRILRAYKFEIIWLAIVGLGVFLIFERSNNRNSMFGWLRQVSAVALGGVGRLGDQLGALLAWVTLSNAIGFMLVLGALVAIALRVRWRLLQNPALTLLRCPSCSGNIHRVHRHAADRLISLYVPVQRYRCANDQCRWHGRRVGAGRGSGRSSSRGHS
jgi:hypothetical protein